MESRGGGGGEGGGRDAGEVERGSLPPAHCPRGRRIDPEAAAVIRPLIKCQSPTHPLTRPCPAHLFYSLHRAHVSLPRFSSFVSRPPPRPTAAALLYSIRPLLAARTRVSDKPPPLNHHACDRHTHRDIAVSCVNHHHLLPRRSPPRPDPRGHHTRCFIAGDRGMRRG